MTTAFQYFYVQHTKSFFNVYRFSSRCWCWLLMRHNDNNKQKKFWKSLEDKNRLKINPQKWRCVSTSFHPVVYISSFSMRYWAAVCIKYFIVYTRGWMLWYFYCKKNILLYYVMLRCINLSNYKISCNGRLSPSKVLSFDFNVWHSMSPVTWNYNNNIIVLIFSWSFRAFGEDTTPAKLLLHINHVS